MMIRMLAVLYYTREHFAQVYKRIAVLVHVCATIISRHTQSDSVAHRSG